MLSNRRRFLLLEELFAREEADFNDLVDEIVKREAGITPAHTDWSDERKKVRVSLYQSHIQKLKDYEIVDYQSKTGRITLGENAGSLSPYLEVAGESKGQGLIGRVSDALRSMCD